MSVLSTITYFTIQNNFSDGINNYYKQKSNWKKNQSRLVKSIMLQGSCGPLTGNLAVHSWCLVFCLRVQHWFPAQWTPRAPSQTPCAALQRSSLQTGGFLNRSQTFSPHWKNPQCAGIWRKCWNRGTDNGQAGAFAMDFLASARQPLGVP